MKNLPTIILCLTGAAAGTGLGWLLRGAPARAAESVNSSAASQEESEASARTRNAGTANDAKDSSSDDLAAELARQKGAMRWLYLLGAAEKATAADMPAMLRAAKDLPGATRMLAVRWAELDPQHMFRTLCADYARHKTGGALAEDYNLRGILFETWAKTDPEAAIAALQDRTALPGVEGERFSMANTIMKTDPLRGMKLLNDWNITSFLPDLRNVSAWVANNPRAAAEAAMQNNLGAATSGMMEQIGKAWAAQDPAAALTFAAERRGLNGIQLARSVMAEWAQRDLAAALAHVNARSESLTKAKLGLPLVEAWAKSDPQAALVWANENLKGEARAAAAASVVKTMAAQDLNAAAELITGLDPGGAKNRAVNQLVESWLGDDWLNKKDGAKATEVLQWMSALPEPDARRYAMEQASWRLFHGAPDETIAFLNSPQGAQAPQQMFDRAAQHLAQKNPESAMQWAAALPPERRSTAQASVLSEWLGSRPEAAQQWVREQPAGNSRAGLVSSATMNLAWHSAETTRAWLESLPATDHAAALQGLKQNGGLSTEQRAALEALVK
jgi:hypothetical protein